MAVTAFRSTDHRRRRQRGEGGAIRGRFGAAAPQGPTQPAPRMSSTPSNRWRWGHTMSLRCRRAPRSDPTGPSDVDRRPLSAGLARHRRVIAARLVPSGVFGVCPFGAPGPPVSPLPLPPPPPLPPPLPACSRRSPPLRRALSPPLLYPRSRPLKPVPPTHFVLARASAAGQHGGAARRRCSGHCNVFRAADAGGR